MPAAVLGPEVQGEATQGHSSCPWRQNTQELRPASHGNHLVVETQGYTPSMNLPSSIPSLIHTQTLGQVLQKGCIITITLLTQNEPSAKLSNWHCHTDHTRAKLGEDHFFELYQSQKNFSTTTFCFLVLSQMMKLAFPEGPITPFLC